MLKTFSRFLLLMLLCAQANATMPEIYDHAEQAQAVHAEIETHVLVLPDSQHEHEDGSQHELHIHACGAHVIAIPVSLALNTEAVHAVFSLQPVTHSSTRSPERLLRPPKA